MFPPTSVEQPVERHHPAYCFVLLWVTRIWDDNVHSVRRALRVREMCGIFARRFIDRRGQSTNYATFADRWACQFWDILQEKFNEKF